MKTLHLCVFIVVITLLNVDVVQSKRRLTSTTVFSSRDAILSPSVQEIQQKKDRVSVLANIEPRTDSLWSNDTYRGIACIVGGALAHLTLGTLYCWGNFLSYAPPSLHFMDGQSHQGITPDALYVLPITLVAQAVSMPFGPSISKLIGYSRTLLLGSWLAALAVFIASYQTRLLPFVLFYSLMFGTGAGIAYTAPMSAGWKWMPQKKGLVSGGILAGFGAGGFIFSMIGSKLVNPLGLNPVQGEFPASVYAAFPRMLRVLAVSYAVVSFVGSLLVQDQKNQEIPNPEVISQNWGVSVKESLRTKEFWLMWAMIISSATAGLNTASIYKRFAASSPALVGDDFQALVGGIGALCNGVGRLFWGSVSDKIGFKASFTILTVIQMLLMLTYKMAAGSKMSFLLNTCLLFFCLAGNLALMPPATQRIFGPHSGAIVYGFLYSAFAIASVIGGILTKALVASVGYGQLFQVMAGMSLFATVLVQFLKPLSSQPKSTI